jgi:hypothetical protein
MESKPLRPGCHPKPVTAWKGIRRMVKTKRSGSGLRYKKALLVCSAWAIFAALPASGQKIQTEFDQAVDFSKFKTFSVEPGRITSPNPSLNNELVKQQIENDIRKYLAERGLTPVRDGRADLHVRYTLGTPRAVETEVYPAGWRGWGSRVVRVPYAEGTLVLDLRDPSTRSLVWRAIARDDESDASKVESKLDAMVKKAVQKYPPKSGR